MLYGKHIYSLKMLFPFLRGLKTFDTKQHLGMYLQFQISPMDQAWFPSNLGAVFGLALSCPVW